MFSAIFRMPTTSIIIILEGLGMYSLVLPAMLCGCASCSVCLLMQKDQIYKTSAHNFCGREVGEEDVVIVVPEPASPPKPPKSSPRRHRKGRNVSPEGVKRGGYISEESSNSTLASADRIPQRPPRSGVDNCDDWLVEVEARSPLPKDGQQSSGGTDVCQEVVAEVSMPRDEQVKTKELSPRPRSQEEKTAKIIEPTKSLTEATGPLSASQARQEEAERLCQAAYAAGLNNVARQLQSQGGVQGKAAAGQLRCLAEEMLEGLDLPHASAPMEPEISREQPSTFKDRDAVSIARARLESAEKELRLAQCELYIAEGKASIESSQTRIDGDSAQKAGQNVLAPKEVPPPPQPQAPPPLQPQPQPPRQSRLASQPPPLPAPPPIGGPTMPEDPMAAPDDEPPMLHVELQDAVIRVELPGPPLESSMLQPAERRSRWQSQMKRVSKLTDGVVVAPSPLSP
eukprot:gnl/TRDRNA2_/TRDRNA2_160365_c1_seq1.p1 gnl/TRDRNA2_/TRDRNA2_160365_c1~~gnl/TRDRNA2_/TRDRNA2_160365_c1_seq1.p1  ORF type:complete len:475 (-),score=86.18 gnl/TRDRNA2_/TRDRNA2_160365_c1_seq1:13-1380(-)